MAIKQSLIRLIEVERLYLETINIYRNHINLNEVRRRIGREDQTSTKRAQKG